MSGTGTWECDKITKLAGLFAIPSSEKVLLLFSVKREIFALYKSM